jgi:DNA-binding transcriptional LysR family regulator
MNLRTFDLNLLVVFDAVMQERNATRAANRLNMTQSATSHALARLRYALGDELFIRTPEGMEPTPFADRLGGSVRAALLDLQSALADETDFDPSASNDAFTIAVDNRSALVLVAPVVAAVAAEAPGIRLDMRPSGALDVPGRLDLGQLDLALGGMASPAERFLEMKLFDDTFVALVRKGHPAEVEGGLTLNDLGIFPHLTLSSTGEEPSFVDAELSKIELRRQVVLRAPLLSSAASLAQSDMIAVVGERTARAFARIAPLQILDLPFASPVKTTFMLWHRRSDDMAAHRWLRSLISRVAGTL